MMDGKVVEQGEFPVLDVAPGASQTLSSPVHVEHTIKHIATRAPFAGVSADRRFEQIGTRVEKR